MATSANTVSHMQSFPISMCGSWQPLCNYSTSEDVINVLRTRTQAIFVVDVACHGVPISENGGRLRYPLNF